MVIVIVISMGLKRPLRDSNPMECPLKKHQLVIVAVQVITGFVN
jgi:hypothetical protein